MRVFLADDHQIVREGARLVLEKAGHEVIGEAGDGQEASRQVRMLMPDLVILDISMPRLNGLDAAREIRRHLPRVRILFLSMHEDADHVADAFRAGARGYVLKSQAIAELAQAIRLIGEGKVYLSPGLAAHVVDACMGNPVSPGGVLTRRERQVLQLVAEGHSTKEVAKLLNICFKTADSHRNHIMKKLDVHNVTGLVRYAIFHGLMQP